MSAFRLRTLPLSLSSIALGSFLAEGIGAFRWSVFLLAALTTLFLQILSNLANDYGDSVKGVDNADRIGPQRSVQSGAISSKSMRNAIVVFSVLSLVSGVWLILEGTVGLNQLYVFGFLALGLGAIAAAIKYTVGERPYGYSGMGDLFVFIFFGLTGVAGTYFLHTHRFDWIVLLPASAIGCLSAGVLNLNNLRDRENDKRSGKNTLVVKLGARVGKIYHLTLLIVAVSAGVIFTALNYHSPTQLLFLITLPLLFINSRAVLTNEKPRELDPQLKKLALTTFLFALTFGTGLII